MKEYNRTKIQELSAVAIYGVLTYAHMGEEVDVAKILSDTFELPYEEVPLFAKEVLINVIKYGKEEIALLEKHMRNWTFDRLNRMEQAILLLAVTQYFHLEEKVDRKVVINVAVNLAHLYLDEKDYKFVNAILDKVLA